ncbi:hypothetical protein LMJF_23_0720 [Leishmania major strain Friedlin]|uniref:RRM domain-containing protein n=1 Tax=Leishmania major TaxID=5664 RepID=Q4QB91_LEIMA|nr:hypothetical protein LMJF_23_0720 [Leishmania major strain Friedlin]CAG9574244.1 RNA_recognition_motif._(a.k.a._RRM_-_RBD_-_or_RNP_domain)/RNA_recognition_motif_(a.k.a._RRM_-_RBD_-_or_RNP_domain)_-_putative [Leishmania major strain Friedlin]CAJ04401.1 hypothetical protein LMJF_23_0720 [Leishmania major strain Friedlin]|eukprot:XP_001683407.1 hypothetical protein LMJF_23_0720 [Leishmania major strain Friedlin]
MMMAGQAAGADSFCKYHSGGAASSAVTPSAGAAGAAGSMSTSLNGAPGQPASVVPLGGAGSFYFSFCGTDGLMIGDTADANLSTTYANTVTTPTFSASNTTANSRAASFTTPGATVASAMQLAAVNLEYFYGIPTPSAPNRADYAASSAASNCSSTSDHHMSERGTAPPPPPPMSTGAQQLTNNVPPQSGVQKDVLALMAAEQQQQKFVLQQRNVYMSGLPINFRPSAFRAMCGVFGRIESSKLCMEADDSSRCRGFGFVLFYDVESANSCISSLNGKVMQGRTLQVRRADLSAAPQPLHPVTQRNRTGSGLVTPPTLGQQTAPAEMPPAPATAAFPLYSPHPPTVGQSSVKPVVMSAVPFTFATPNGVAPPPGSIVHKSASTNASFPLGTNASASSSLGATSTPTVVYASNSTMLSTMRGGVPVMQLFTAVPPGSAPAMGPQPPSAMSHTSLSSRDGATPHTETPSSVASSSAPIGFSASQHLIQLQAPTTQQQQQQNLPQHSIQLKPQPPMHPPAQPQRPMSVCTNVAIYRPLETASSAGNLNLNSSAGGSAMASAYSANGNVLQDYLMGVDPNASSSNVFYFISPP